MIALALISLAMPAPTPPHALGWPALHLQEVPGPDGIPRYVRGWQDLGGFHWRECDQDPHPVHPGSPIDVVPWGRCFPHDCRPSPPGAVPGDWEKLPETPIFRGPPL